MGFKTTSLMNSIAIVSIYEILKPWVKWVSKLWGWLDFIAMISIDGF